MLPARTENFRNSPVRHAGPEVANVTQVTAGVPHDDISRGSPARCMSIGGGTLPREVTMNATVQAPAENEPKLSTVDPPPQANSGPQETAGTPPSGDACSGAANIYVCDHQFIREIRKLQLIRSIQLDERVQQPPEISQLWSLLELRYGRNGRWPYARERADLYQRPKTLTHARGASRLAHRGTVLRRMGQSFGPLV